MSHRRRFLNLVTRNWVTGVHSLRRVDLHSRQNNLFYPTPAAAEAAAAAHDPSALFADAPTKRRRKVALKKVPRIHVPAPAQSFRLCNGSSDARDRSMDCVALSESETVFLDLVDHTSRRPRGAFVYDAGGRCVVSLPNPHAMGYRPICLSLTGAGTDGSKSKHDTVYVMERSPSSSEEKRVRFQALVHQKVHCWATIYEDRWRCDEVPPPPGCWGAGIDSHAVIGGGASDVICISTEGMGTYCFDTASREWSKAGDWALPFSGKIERDADTGVWAGFLEFYRSDEAHRLCVTADLFSDVERHRVALCRDAPLVIRDDCRELEPPLGWYKDGVPRGPHLVSLGSGKFCLVQFFETREEACTECQHEEVEDKLAVFTGVEVMRCGGGGEEVQAGDGGAKDEGAGDELRIVVHKSKRYMLTNFEGTIDFVL